MSQAPCCCVSATRVTDPAYAGYSTMRLPRLVQALSDNIYLFKGLCVRVVQRRASCAQHADIRCARYRAEAG